jgi:hypothetical protein
MVRRSQRYFGEQEKARLLEAIGMFRTACREAQVQLKPFGDVYSAINKLGPPLDDVTELLTGDRTYFHLKAHSSPARSPKNDGQFTTSK